MEVKTSLAANATKGEQKADEGKIEDVSLIPRLSDLSVTDRVLQDDSGYPDELVLDADDTNAEKNYIASSAGGKDTRARSMGTTSTMKKRQHDSSDSCDANNKPITVSNLAQTDVAAKAEYPQDRSEPESDVESGFTLSDEEEDDRKNIFGATRSSLTQALTAERKGNHIVEEIADDDEEDDDEDWDSDIIDRSSTVRVHSSTTRNNNNNMFLSKQNDSRMSSPMRAHSKSATGAKSISNASFSGSDYWVNSAAQEKADMQLKAMEAGARFEAQSLGENWDDDFDFDLDNTNDGTISIPESVQSVQSQVINDTTNLKKFSFHIDDTKLLLRQISNLRSNISLDARFNGANTLDAATQQAESSTPDKSVSQKLRSLEIRYLDIVMEATAIVNFADSADNGKSSSLEHSFASSPSLNHLTQQQEDTTADITNRPDAQLDIIVRIIDSSQNQQQYNQTVLSSHVPFMSPSTSSQTIRGSTGALNFNTSIQLSPNTSMDSISVTGNSVSDARASSIINSHISSAASSRHSLLSDSSLQLNPLAGVESGAHHNGTLAGKSLTRSLSMASTKSLSSTNMGQSAGGSNVSSPQQQQLAGLPRHLTKEASKNGNIVSSNVSITALTSTNSGPSSSLNCSPLKPTNTIKKTQQVASPSNRSTGTSRDNSKIIFDVRYIPLLTKHLTNLKPELLKYQKDLKTLSQKI